MSDIGAGPLVIRACGFNSEELLTEILRWINEDDVPYMTRLLEEH